MGLLTAPGENTYLYLEPIGHLPFNVYLSHKRDIHIRYDEPLFMELPEIMRVDLLTEVGEYYMSYGDVSSVDVSVRKMDVKKATCFLEKSEFKFALDFLYRTYGPLFEKHTRHSNSEEIVSKIDLDKSSGVPWGPVLGLKKKKDVLLSEHSRYMFYTPEQMGPAIWRVVPKTEWYPLFKLMENKVRTFIIPPMHLVWHTEFFFLSQNEAMKRSFWSAYGFNPYQGGTNALAQSLLKDGNIILSYDVKSYDRVHALMQQIYDFRASFYMDHEEYDDLLDWVIQNIVETLILLPNGDVLKKLLGNNSGGVGTTQDNILGHIIALAYTLAHIYGKDFDLIRKVIANIFGDDNIMSIPLPKSNDWESLFRQGFRDFNWELDPFIISNDLTEHTFLGFTFKKWKGLWVPQYPADRLATSFCYTIESNMSIQAQFTKMYSLLVMSATHDHLFGKMQQAFAYLIGKYRDYVDPVIDTFAFYGPPSQNECLRWMAGLEGPELCMEVGWHKVTSEYVKAKCQNNNK